MVPNDVIIVQETEIRVTERNGEDYISLTDMCKAFGDGDQLIKNWLQNKNTIEFLQVWEEINNPNFNLVELHQIKNNIGLIAKTGRYGSGTYAHKDIALEFGSWLSPEFKLYLIKEFQRLKQKEAQENKTEWNVKRILSKANYRIHTDAIQAHLIPRLLNSTQPIFVYSAEADILNQAMFGLTAKQWREQNPTLKGNIRDYASVEQLTVLAALESQNALLIEQGVSQKERLTILNRLAIQQMQSLLKSKSLEPLKDKPLLIEDRE
ncbi:KilA-N domain-containing protein [Glaesserella parasuis]|uniref:KilA-N domain-containing protein n=1 Tax=Glaesserella parasuis TaxID=738 RepID=UPI003B10A0B9